MYKFTFKEETKINSYEDRKGSLRQQHTSIRESGTTQKHDNQTGARCPHAEKWQDARWHIRHARGDSFPIIGHGLQVSLVTKMQRHTLTHTDTEIRKHSTARPQQCICRFAQPYRVAFVLCHDKTAQQHTRRVWKDKNHRKNEGRILLGQMIGLVTNTC